MEEDGKLDHSPSGREMAAVDNLGACPNSA